LDRIYPTLPILAFALLVMLIEAAWRLRSGRGYDGVDAWATGRIAIGHIAASAANGVLIGLAFAVISRLRPVHWPLDDWRTWAVGFVAVEFAYYWFHRLNHQIRWMWATHMVHHSVEQLTLLSSLRLGWTNFLSLGWLVYVPIVLAGFDLKLVMAILSVDLQYQFFLHTEARIPLGPLEWVLNTPSHHRVHHACNGSYLDKNYGGMVIVFDRLFGTFAEERPAEPLRYGLVHPLASRSTVELAFGGWRRLLGEMRRAGSLGAALRVAVSRP
jgi:sterol desaturase/sphingolipid hydroxylase (fatty acid hydroxylase superfamily)